MFCTERWGRVLNRWRGLLNVERWSSATVESGLREEAVPQLSQHEQDKEQKTEGLQILQALVWVNIHV